MNQVRAWSSELFSISESHPHDESNIFWNPELFMVTRVPDNGIDLVHFEISRVQYVGSLMQVVHRLFTLLT